jgi:hypothetical protein
VTKTVRKKLRLELVKLSELVYRMSYGDNRESPTLGWARLLNARIDRIEELRAKINPMNTEKQERATDGTVD